jgi:phospholipid N-methyltransferase
MKKKVVASTGQARVVSNRLGSVGKIEFEEGRSVRESGSAKGVIDKAILANDATLKSDRAFVSDALKPSLSLLCILGSIAVHMEEAMSSKGHPLDIVAMKSALDNPELRQWIKDMGVYMPVKR